MPVGIMQPSGQVKLTNVAYVRMKKGKKHYEIACYKNKILEWHAEIETDPNNVLQLDEVYISVAKGEKASSADLERDFKISSKDKKIQKKEVVAVMLNSSKNFQVGEEERKAQLDRIHHEVVNIVATKVVDPKTKRVYTTDHIEKMLNILSSQAAQQQQQQAAKAATAVSENGEDKGKEGQLRKWRGVTAKKNAKEQANWAIKALVASDPTQYAKARMRLRVVCPTAMLKHAVKHAPQASDSISTKTKPTGNLKDTIVSHFEEVEDQETTGDEWEVIGFADPGSLNILQAILTQTKGRGGVEVLDTALVHEDD